MLDGRGESVGFVGAEEERSAACQPDLDGIPSFDIIEPAAGSEMDSPAVQPGGPRADGAGNAVERNAAANESDPEPEPEVSVGDLDGQPAEQQDADDGGAEHDREHENTVGHRNERSGEECGECDDRDEDASDLGMSIGLSHRHTADPVERGSAVAEV